MKHFIWMLCGIFVSGLLLGTLSGCGNELALSGPEPVLAAAGISEEASYPAPPG